jgi:hypothetical protein
MQDSDVMQIPRDTRSLLPLHMTEKHPCCPCPELLRQREVPPWGVGKCVGAGLLNVLGVQTLVNLPTSHTKSAETDAQSVCDPVTKPRLISGVICVHGGAHIFLSH